MKHKLLFGIGATCLVAFALMAADYSARTDRYRSGSWITFDGGSGIKDEDGSWTLTWAELKSIGNGTIPIAQKAEVVSTEADMLLGVTSDYKFTVTGLAPGLIGAQWGTAALTNLSNLNGGSLTNLNAANIAGTTFTGSITVVTNGTDTMSLLFTNGILRAVAAP